MKKKRFLYFAGLLLFFIVIFFSTLFVFFPYKKLINFAANNLLTDSTVKFSMDGIKISPFHARIKTLTIGYENIGKIIELEDFELNFDFFELLRGKARVKGGERTKKLYLDIYVPLFKNAIPVLNVNFKGLVVSLKNEDNTLIKGLRGKINGVFKKNVDVYYPEKNKGEFFITIKDGEIEGLNFQRFPKLNIPFDEFVLKGSSTGNKTKIELLSIKSSLGSIRGSGEVLSFKDEERINLTLFLKDFHKTPLANISEVKISGNLLNFNSLTFSPVMIKSAEKI